MIYKKNTLRRAAAAAAAICLAFAFAFAEETGADRLGFGTSITVSAADEVYTIGTAKIYYTKDASGNVTITKVEAGDETSIQIPKTIDGGEVKAIGSNAFDGCTSLESVFYPSLISGTDEIPSGTAQVSYTKTALDVTVDYVYTANKTSFEIPETIDRQAVTAIGRDAFRSNYYLESVTLPQSVKSIGKSAFENCYDLTSINIPQKVTAISDRTFSGCPSLKSVNIPSNVTSIGEYAFENCISLANITIPSSVTSIGEGAFFNCYALANVTIPSSVTSIGDLAFHRCTSLESIILPPSVTSIGDNAFKDCTSLETVIFPQSAKLGTQPFPSGTAQILYTKDASTGNVTVTDVEAGTQTSIEIPETIDEGTVKIIGANAFEDCDTFTSITLPQSLTSIEDFAFCRCTALQNINIPQNVTNIGVSAFKECKSLTSITIPSGVTSINDVAFAHCTSLKSIELPDHLVSIGVSAFTNCTSLESVVIPAEVTSVGFRAFTYCTSLESVVIPMSVISVGDSAFDGCTSLKAVFAKEGLPLELASIPSGAVKIYYQVEDLGYVSILKAHTGTQAGIECIEIPKTIGGLDVRVIKEEAFRDCGNIKKIILPDSIREIQNSAFSYCTSLESINIPVGITSIGDYAFEDCTALKSVVIPQSVTNIGYAAFSRCDKLVSIDIPMGVSMISNHTFENCISLTAINIPTSVRQIGDESFMGCTALESIDIPEGVTSVGQSAFMHCTALESAALPDSLTEIKAGAFQDCTALKSINIPKGVTSIEAFAFSYCQALADVTLPESIQGIDMYAFDSCSSLETIVLPPSTTYVRVSAFANCTSLKTIFLPQNAAQETASIPDTIRGYEVKYVEEEYRQYVSETGHTHKGGTATCTEKALCDICGNSYDSTDSTNHDADTSVWKYDENGHWNPCLRAGCEEHLNAAAHTFDNGVITAKPTDTTDGVRTYTCTVCGYEKTEAVPKLGHIPSAEWSYDSENHWKKCTAEGCDEKLELAAHTFDNGVITTRPTENSEGVKTYTCTVCGYEKTESIEKLPSKPAKVIYPITISGDVTADKSSAAAGENVNVSAPFGYDIIVADINGGQIAKFSEKGSFEMPASGVSITAVRGEIFTHMSNAWSHSYVYSYDSDMNRIKVNSDTRRGVITIDLGADYAGRDFTVYSGRKNTSKKIISGTLDENGRYIFNSEEGKNYTLVVE